MVVEYLSGGSNRIEDFKLDTSMSTLRNKMARFIADAYEEMDRRPEVVHKAWKLARAGGMSLLDAWTKPVQDKALELMAGAKLFPNQLKVGDEFSIDVGIENDADEVSSDALIARLLQAEWDDGNDLYDQIEDFAGEE